MVPRVCPTGFPFLFWFLNTCLKIRVTERGWESSHRLVYFPNEYNRVGPVCSQKPRASSASPMWVAGVWTLCPEVKQPDHKPVSRGHAGIAYCSFTHNTTTPAPSCRCLLSKRSINKEIKAETKTEVVGRNSKKISMNPPQMHSSFHSMRWRGDITEDLRNTVKLIISICQLYVSPWNAAHHHLCSMPCHFH